MKGDDSIIFSGSEFGGSYWYPITLLALSPFPDVLIEIWFVVNVFFWRLWAFLKTKLQQFLLKDVKMKCIRLGSWIFSSTEYPNEHIYLVAEIHYYTTT